MCAVNLLSIHIHSENLFRMSVALKNNPRSALVHLDLSDNSFDDKCMFTVYVLLYNYYGKTYILLLMLEQFNCILVQKWKWYRQSLLRLFSRGWKSYLVCFLIMCPCWSFHAAIESLGTALENLPHGLQHLVLANCKISNRGRCPRGDNEVLCLLFNNRLFRCIINMMLHVHMTMCIGAWAQLPLF